MVKKYISDIITEEEIAGWKPNSRILVEAPTGSGKSYFIKHKLGAYCQKTNKKLLLLTNRTSLKKQNEAEFMTDENFTASNITFMNYQKIESLCDDDKEGDHIKILKGIFFQYDFIVFDEAHYIFADSAFNNHTDIFFPFIYPQPDQLIYIFISATPNLIHEYEGQLEKERFTKIFKVEFDYSFIDNLYFYKKDDIIENILYTIPEDEKVIFFGSSEKAFDLSTKVANSAFLCSRSNKKYGKHRSKAVAREIEEFQCFSTKHLFCTKVLDNGVSIKDSKVKHIIIDQFEPITIIQCLGRKRIDEDEKIKVYIKNQDRRRILLELRQITSSISQIEGVINDKDGYLKVNKRKELDKGIFRNGDINFARYMNLLYYKDIYRYILNIGYDNYLCRTFQLPLEDVITIEENLENTLIRKLIKDYLNRKLYKEEQDLFTEQFFDNIFAPKKRNYRNKGKNAINGILSDMSLNYRLISKQERTGRERHRYWMIVEDIVSETTFN